MKTIVTSSVLLAMLLAACGGQPEELTAASPLDVLPETSLFSVALVNPSAVISAIDGYAAGVPVLGESAVSSWILSALNCADMSEVDSRLGIRTEGGLAVYMESMMPQSMGGALTVTDPATFWANIGVTPQAAEAIEGYEVTSIPVDFGDLYFCHTNGLLLAAGSRAGLQAMLGRLDGEIPPSIPDIPDGSFYMFTNIETFGPMMAGQLAMLKTQLVAEMTAEGGMNADMMQGIMDLYFDAVGMVLTETRSWSCVLTLGPEYITGTSKLEFIPGSTLDRYMIPVEPEDMTDMIPAGDVMVARVSIDPVTSSAAINAVFGAMGMTGIPQDMVEFWAQSAKNTAVSWVFDSVNPIHIIGLYDVGENVTLEDVKNAYDAQFQMMGSFLTMPGLTLMPVDYAEYSGMEWISFGMEMDMSAMRPDSIENSAPMAGSISWIAWMTLHDGVLYLEMAREPMVAAAIIDGTYQGGYASDMPEMGDFSPSSEMAMLFNIPGYLNMAMAMSGLEVPPIDSEPVWMHIEVDLHEGGMSSKFSVSGTDMSVFIGKAIQTFAALAQ
ncbi:MAG: hypothetical protein JXA64_08475 [Candidatus Fermentibacteraceae bacterium]|nr:hypothetical protein [Candidatus Fermentibacteraceae bacterium]MBN2609136.1 hypothetical protein [Candidatus Fermentibacteraceae bacterium]